MDARFSHYVHVEQADMQGGEGEEGTARGLKRVEEVLLGEH